MNQEVKHIHFIGICGVAMSALAIAFKHAGYTVTGSDKGFFPPVSTRLKDENINYYPGWHVKKMTANGNPDLVIVGNVAGSKNPEWIYTQEQRLNYLSYPEAIAKYFIKDKAIVCAGTYGKTSITTLLSWIFTHTKTDASYMFGGLIEGGFPSAHIGSGETTILEGDEYKTARWDDKAKFFHYQPGNLILSGLQWDHADIYPTEEDYFNAFDALFALVPDNGTILCSEDVPDFFLNKYIDQKKIYRYGMDEKNDVVIRNIVYKRDGLSFEISYDSNTYVIQSHLLGNYMAKNITACFAMALLQGLEPETIIDAIKAFPGIKRRLEKRLDGDILVIDDIAHSPAKAKSALDNLRAITEGKIIAIYEPNTGNRQHAAIPGYSHAFQAADLVIIPRLSKIKKDLTKKEAPLDGEGLAEVIAQTHDNVQYLADDDTLISSIIKEAKAGDSVIFLGSHGFRGMIEEVVEKLQSY